MNQRFEAIERWAKYVRESNGEWKKAHTEFIDAQFQKAYEIMDRLRKTKEGKEKIMKMYNIKNVKGYPKLLGKITSKKELNHLFRNTKKIHPKYNLSAKQMDKLIEKEIVK